MYKGKIIEPSEDAISIMMRRGIMPATSDYEHMLHDKNLQLMELQLYIKSIACSDFN